MTINNKSERNYRGTCLGWPVTSYDAVCDLSITVIIVRSQTVKQKNITVAVADDIKKILNRRHQIDL